MRIKKALFLGTLCTAVSGMSLFAQAGVSYAKSAKEATEEASSEEVTEVTSEEETSEEVTYPITIGHAFGETVIESKPERINHRDRNGGSLSVPGGSSDSDTLVKN